MQYKVTCLNITGKRKRIYVSGDIIQDADLQPNAAERYLKSGHIQLITHTEPTPELIKPDKLKAFKGKIRLCVVTGMWQRPNVFKIFGEHYKKLGIDVIVAGSEGETSRSLAESFGFIYIEMPNQPLATKMNATTIKAVERGYTHVICVGSDDLISAEMLKHYTKLAKQGYYFVGVTDFYFYDTESKNAAYWGGYREKWRMNHTAGAARMLSSELLKDWSCCPWEDRLSGRLDTAMQKRLDVSHRPSKIFSLREAGLFAVDVKSLTNMTPFELWPNTSYIDPTIITSRFNVWNSVSVK